MALPNGSRLYLTTVRSDWQSVPYDFVEVSDLCDASDSTRDVVLKAARAGRVTDGPVEYRLLTINAQGYPTHLSAPFRACKIETVKWEVEPC